MDGEFRELLLEIAQKLTFHELVTMKFLLLGNSLPDFEPDDFKSILVDTLKFFCDLEKKEELGVNNLDRLVYLLEKAQRSDLVSRVKDFQTRYKTNGPTKTNITGSASMNASSSIRSVQSTKSHQPQHIQELYPDKDAQKKEYFAEACPVLDKGGLARTKDEELAKVKKRAKKRNYKKRKKSEKNQGNTAESFLVTAKSEMLKHDLPETKKTNETATQGLLANKESQMVTQGLPVNKESQMVTQGLPVNKESQMVTQGLPLNKESQMVTQGLPLNKESQIVTQGLPLNKESQMVTQGLPANKESQMVTQGLPANKESQMVTQGLPVNKESQIVTQGLPLNKKSQMVTQGLPVNKESQMVTQGLPVNKESQMVTQGLPVNKERQMVTQGVQVSKKSQMVTQGLPVNKKSQMVTQGLPLTKRSDTVTQGLPVGKRKETATEGFPVKKEIEMVTEGLPLTKRSDTVTQGLPVGKRKETATEGFPVKKEIEMVTEGLPLEKKNETVGQDGIPETKKRETVTQKLQAGKINTKVKVEGKHRTDGGLRSSSNKDFSGENTFQQMRILSLCNKWQSWGESVPVINRELCLALARAGHTVACLALKSTDFEKEEARKGNVELIQCSYNPGIKSDDPQLLYHDQQIPFNPDLVIGHGKLTGPASVFYAKKASCPRLHVIHDLPSECPRLDSIVTHECDEESLARSADFVAVIGTLLKEKWSTIINREVIEIVPGLPELTTRNTISSPQCRCLVPAKFCSPDASGLRIAVMAVNYSSKREKQPRKATFIACNTDSTGSLKPARKILKDCDKKTVDLKELTSINCQQAYFEIQGATVFLSPARVEAFGVAALDAIAIGIPIFISAQSGLAYTIRQHLNTKFHSCIIDVANACLEEDEDKDASICSISLDKISLNRDQAFSFANDLRSGWKAKFSWDAAVQNLTHLIVQSGKLPSRSPSTLQNSILAKEIPESCLNLVKELNLFDKRQTLVLFLSPEDPQFLQNAVHLGLVQWAAVFDFDRESTTKGYLKSCESFLETIAKPACRLMPPPKEDAGKEKQNFTLPNGIPWILIQGQPGMERDIEGNLDWIQEVFNHLKKRHPGIITLLVIWKSTSDTKNLCKKLYKTFTVIQASSSWKNSVEVKILSTSDLTDKRIEDIAEEWEVRIKKVDITQLCDAIYSTAIANPLYKLDPDFSLPKRIETDGRVAISLATIPSSMRWVDSVLEVLFASIGKTPEFGQDDAYHFYRGGTISWYGIEMNYAVERESWESLKKVIEEEMEYPGAAFHTLFHQRGTGGTTSSRKLLYDFHLRYPCVRVRNVNYETFLAIREIWKFCSLPVVILADIKEAPGGEDNDIEALFGNLSNDKVSCLILHIVHRHYQVVQKKNKQPDKKETNILAKPLTEKEREKFVKVYSLQSPTKKSELVALRNGDEQLQIPFYYGLVAFGDQFEGLGRFVSDCLKGLNDGQRKALFFLSMAYQYARTELPLSTFAGIFRLKPRHLHSIEDILTPDSIELLIEEDGRWRPRHYTIGKEMLRQLLTVPYNISPKNWKRNLADKAEEFIAYMEEDITIAVLVNRISDEKTFKHFSSLVEDIPESEDVVKVFEKAISSYPYNPFFKAHLGRYYSVSRGIDGFSEALTCTEEGILLASDMSKNVRSQLIQMKGIVFKRQVRNKIERKADLNDVISLAEEGVKAFTRAASIYPEKPENFYIPQVRMMCDIFKYVDRAFNGGIFAYLKSTEAHPFILDGISETSDILESVSDSLDYPVLRRELFKLGLRGAGRNKSDNKAGLIKHFEELKKTSKTSTASINRQIVLIRLEICKEENKQVSEIAKELIELLDEALKFDNKIDLTMRLWVRVAPHIPVELQAAEGKIAAWCNKGKSAMAYLYRYIFTCIRILEGGKDQEDRIFAWNELNKAVHATKRLSLIHPDRPVVFLGNGKGMGQLVILERESVKEVKKQRTIPESYAGRLRRLTGIITRTGKVGQINADGLIISFRADLCHPPLVGASYLNKKVRLYLAFTYFETDAYNVKIMAE